MSNLRAIASKKIAKEKTRRSGRRKNTASAPNLTHTAQEEVDNWIVWYQFNPDVPEGLQEQKSTPPNSATIRAISKKLIAKEWRRTRGKPRRDPRLARLISEAENWSEQRELEKKKEEAGHLLDDK